MPGIAAARRDRNLFRIVGFVVTAASHETTGSQMRQIATLEIAPRSGLAERCQRTEDQLRIVGFQTFVVEAQRRQVARLEGLEHDIGFRRQPPEQRPPALGLQVQCDAALGGVVVPERQAAVAMRLIVEKRADGPGFRTRRRFDLDHISAQIGHQLPGELALFIRQLEHSKPVQRARPDRIRLRRYGGRLRRRHGDILPRAVGRNRIDIVEAVHLFRPEDIVLDSFDDFFMAQAEQAFQHLLRMLADEGRRAMVRHRCG